MLGVNANTDVVASINAPPANDRIRKALRMKSSDADSAALGKLFYFEPFAHILNSMRPAGLQLYAGRAQLTTRGSEAPRKRPERGCLCLMRDRADLSQPKMHEEASNQSLKRLLRRKEMCAIEFRVPKVIFADCRLRGIMPKSYERPTLT